MAAKMGPRLEPGELVLVEYNGDPGTFHARGVLRKASSAILAHVMGFKAQGPESGIYWVVTPTGDIYPEILGIHADMSGFCVIDPATDDVMRGTMKPLGRRLEEVFGFEEWRSIGD